MRSRGLRKALGGGALPGLEERIHAYNKAQQALSRPAPITRSEEEEEVEAQLLRRDFLGFIMWSLRGCIL